MVGTLRYEYNKKNLAQEKIDFVESLPKWSWDVRTDKWLEGFNSLKIYAAREGHTLVPVKHIEDGISLGVWVRTQRYSYAKPGYGKKLSQYKIQLLESIPGWAW